MRANTTPVRSLAIVAGAALAFIPRASLAVVGGYAATTSSNIVFVDGDGETVLNAPTDTIVDVTGLTNGNVVGRVSADQWRLFDSEGNILATRQLDNLGTFLDAVPVGGGGYAAMTDANVIFVGSDGETIVNVFNDVLTFATPLTNGNVIALQGVDLWRLYDPAGNVVTRALDNSGVFNASAALGGGGYAAVSDSRIIFMGADGLTVNNVVTDAITFPTSLSNGNLVGRVGADVWRLYDPSGNVLFTRALDSLGTFVGAAAVGGGGYVAYSDTNAVFIAADGDTVSNVVPNALEFVTPLNNGNVVGKLAGTDLWRLFDSAGNILATRSLDNLGTFTGAVPIGLAADVSLPGDFDGDGDVDGSDLAVWTENFGLLVGATSETGDADDDGDVDGNDFLVWQQNFTPVPVTSTIPEPTSLGLLAVAGCILVANGRAKSRLRS